MNVAEDMTCCFKFILLLCFTRDSVGVFFIILCMGLYLVLP